MEEFINFLIEVGKLKKIKRRGWIIRGVKNPESIADHTFRMALMAWILGKEKGLDAKKLLKIALFHDLCEVYAGDLTPYDPLLSKDKNKKIQKKLVKKFPRFLMKEEIKILLEKQKKEWKALEKLVSQLPSKRAREIVNLWLDFNRGLTKEGRFLRQVDKIENLLQALEYWQEDKKFPIKPWWVEIKELVDDPLLIKFVEELDKKFHQKEKKSQKRTSFSKKLKKKK